MAKVKCNYQIMKEYDRYKDRIGYGLINTVDMSTVLYSNCKLYNYIIIPDSFYTNKDKEDILILKEKLKYIIPTVRYLRNKYKDDNMKFILNKFISDNDFILSSYTKNNPNHSIDIIVRNTTLNVYMMDL